MLTIQPDGLDVVAGQAVVTGDVFGHICYQVILRSATVGADPDLLLQIV
jgi:hypothetical protein